MRMKTKSVMELGGPPAQEGPQTGRDRAPVSLMLGLDTNVLVRFLVRDHEAQFERARRLIKREIGAKEKVLISLLVLLETEWVLRSRYGHAQNIKSSDAISGLLDAAELEFEDEPTIEEALYLWKDSAANLPTPCRGPSSSAGLPRHRNLRCKAVKSPIRRGLICAGQAWTASQAEGTLADSGYRCDRSGLATSTGADGASRMAVPNPSDFRLFLKARLLTET